jgi:hypothetical protein
MNAVFTPLGLVFGLLAGQVSKEMWGLVDDEEAPRPSTLRSRWSNFSWRSSSRGRSRASSAVLVDLTPRVGDPDRRLARRGTSGARVTPAREIGADDLIERKSQ